MSAPYTAIAKVYDRRNAVIDYTRWAEFIMRRLPDPAERGVRVLDLCCGTGTIAGLLTKHGYAVTGVDQSAEMIAIARTAVPAATFICAALPECRLGVHGEFDAAVCTFDSLNYMVMDGAVRRLLTQLTEVMRPSGAFIFDVNTRHKLELADNRHHGDDLGDYAYVWRNRLDGATHRIEFLITLFTEQDGAFLRETEHHVQRWFERPELEADAAATGFTVETVTDDYTDSSATGQTTRETWVLRRSTTPATEMRRDRGISPLAHADGTASVLPGSAPGSVES